METIKSYTITGQDAIRLAERDGLTLRKYADPTEGARTVTPNEAREIAREDASLIYVTVAHAGYWTDGTGHEGYQVSDYFDWLDRYQGADHCGIEPRFQDDPVGAILCLPGVIDAAWMTSPGEPAIMVQCGPDADVSLLPGKVIDGSTVDEDGCFDVVISL